MHVNFYATFRQQAGVKSIELDMPKEPTMRQAVDAIIAVVPALKSIWLTDEGEIQNYVYGFINGTDVSTLPDGWETSLKPDDVLDFLPPVAGGS
jgi:MoaD family protein